MTRHPSFAALRRFESANLSGDGDARLNHHLAGCRRCQDAVRRIRAIRAGAAELLDPPVPEDGWTAIEERLDAGEAVLLPAAGVSYNGRQFRARHLAGLAVILSASAAAALAAPPIATWAAGLFEPPPVTEPSPVAEPLPVTDAPPETGVAAMPQSGRLLVKLTANASDVTVQVRRASSPLLEVRGRGAATAAQFVLTGETVEVVGATGGTILILVPDGVTARLATGSRVLVLDDSVDIVVPAIGETR